MEHVGGRRGRRVGREGEILELTIARAEKPWSAVGPIDVQNARKGRGRTDRVRAGRVSTPLRSCFTSPDS